MEWSTSSKAAYKSRRMSEVTSPLSIKMLNFEKVVSVEWKIRGKQIEKKKTQS